MLRNMLANRRNDDKGFTLIELLVVILIIGILAAIALPTFLGQSAKAEDSSAKSDVRNAVTQMESCLVDDTYLACSTGTANPGAAIVQSGVEVVAGGTEDAYSLRQTSESDNVFTIRKTGSGTFERTCSTTGEGGCPSSGSW